MTASNLSCRSNSLISPISTFRAYSKKLTQTTNRLPLTNERQSCRKGKKQPKKLSRSAFSQLMKSQVSIRTKEESKSPFENLYDPKLTGKTKIPVGRTNPREYKPAKQKRKNFCYLTDKQERPNVQMRAQYAD